MITIICLIFALGALVAYEYVKMGAEAEIRRNKDKENDQV